MDYNSETGQYLQILLFFCIFYPFGPQFVLQLCPRTHLDLGPIATGSVMVYHSV